MGDTFMSRLLGVHNGRAGASISVSVVNKPTQVTIKYQALRYDSCYCMPFGYELLDQTACVASCEHRTGQQRPK